MKKTIFALALAASGLVAIPAFAQDSAPKAQQGWYVAGDAGYANLNKGPYNDGDFTGGIKGGYRFAINPETSLGVEAGYVYLGRDDANHSDRNIPGSTAKGQSKLQGATLGADLRYHITSSWYADLRAGGISAKGEGVTDDSNPRFEKFRNTKYYAGAGVGYNINEHFSVALNYNYYAGDGEGVKLDTSAYTASAEYRF